MIEAATTTEWNGVLQDLRSKRQLAIDNLASLRGTKRELALDAAMGNTDAQKRLDRINAELNRFSLEVDSLDMALDKATAMTARQAAVDAEVVERARQAELATLAEAALRHAEQFTAALRAAVLAASAVSNTIRAMISHATPQEMGPLNQLLSPGPFMRCAEYVGLKDTVIEFAGYTGPRTHLGNLEDELSILVERWKQPDNREIIQKQELQGVQELQEDGSVVTAKNGKPNGKEYKNGDSNPKHKK